GPRRGLPRRPCRRRRWRGCRDGPGASRWACRRRSSTGTSGRRRRGSGIRPSVGAAARRVWTWVREYRTLDAIVIRAGKRALEHIRSHGLDPAHVEIVPGAAGGPKGLGIAGLDRAIFADWLAAVPRTRHLIGASIGAWRFAAACRKDPLQALADFAHAYTHQSYPPRPSPKLVSQA